MNAVRNLKRVDLCMIVKIINSENRQPRSVKHLIVEMMNVADLLRRVPLLGRLKIAVLHENRLQIKLRMNVLQHHVLLMIVASPNRLARDSFVQQIDLN
jgi:hypothetical protein